MLNIPGLDPFGLAHAAIGVTALVLGLVVIAQAKGSASHRVWGSAYVIAMVLLNASALTMYDGLTVAVSTLTVVGIGALLIRKRVPHLAARFGAPSTSR